MSKFRLLWGGLLAIALFLASCESYNLEPGQVPGGVGKIELGQVPGGMGNMEPGQVPGGTGNMEPGQAPEGSSNSEPDQGWRCEPNPDFLCKINDNPHTPKPSQSPPIRPTQPVENNKMTDWRVYNDNAYHYQIAYPTQFEFRVLETAELAELKPKPVAGIYLRLPSKNLSGIAIQTFSIRIYEIGEETSVVNWLKNQGLFDPDAGGGIEIYQGKHFSGYKVNSALYMAPGWSIYAAHGDYIYQLTPLGSDAERMLTTFEFTQ